jgi:hypothetical protein
MARRAGQVGEGLTVGPDDMMYWDVCPYREPQLSASVAATR